MVDEDHRWMNILAEYELAPANGIRGVGLKRKTVYIRQDANLVTLFQEFENREPINYLRAVSYHLHF